MEWGSNYEPRASEEDAPLHHAPSGMKFRQHGYCLSSFPSNIMRKRLGNSICSCVNAYLWLLQGFVCEHPRPRYERVDKFWVEGTEAFGSQSGSYQQQQLKEPVYGNQLIHFYRVSSITTALYTTLIRPSSILLKFSPGYFTEQGTLYKK